MYKGQGGGVALLILSIFLKYPMKMEKIWSHSETKLFHFHRIFENSGRGEGVRANPLWICHCLKEFFEKMDSE